MKPLGKIIVVALALVGVGAIIVVAWLIYGGISTKSEPGTAEVFLARRLRSIAIPRAAYERTNPFRHL